MDDWSAFLLVGFACWRLVLPGIGAGRHHLAAVRRPLQPAAVRVRAGGKLPVVLGERIERGEPFLAFDVPVKALEIGPDRVLPEVAESSLTVSGEP